MELVSQTLNGSKLAAGRIIKSIEDDDGEGVAALKDLYPHTGHAFIIGVTGPPGAGKSTLIDCLIASFRACGQTVAVLAIDPSSAITGGAILGDRIRMKRHALDTGVFIRSVATRGALGGVSRVTKGALIVLDAMKFDVILVETAGVGQLDIDISGLVHMTLVLCIPGMGDGLQAMKSGTMEIADLFIVNKADLPGANDVANYLETLMELRGVSKKERPPILFTSALEEKGMEDVLPAIEEFRKKMETDETLPARTGDRECRYFKSIIREIAAEKITDYITRGRDFSTCLDQINRRETDPYSAARELVEVVLAALKAPGPD